MAKKAYIGVDGVARKVKKGYIGVNDKARKIKKAYIGVGGVARPCWSGGEVTYYGTVAPLSAARMVPAPVGVGNYLLFPAGTTSNTIGSPTWSTVDTYDASLTKGLAADLSAARGNFSSAQVGNHALIAGGYSRGTEYSNVDVYDSQLTHTMATSLGAASTGNAAGGSVPNYAVFAFKKYGCAYNASLTRVSISYDTFSDITSSSSVDGYFIVTAGGTTLSYNQNLTKQYLTPLSVSRWFTSLRAGTKGHALFAGGTPKWGDASVSTVDAYNTSLTRSVLSDLSVARCFMGGVNLDGNAIIACGSSTQNNNYFPQVDVYDQQLVHKTLEPISPEVKENYGGVVGNYAIFAGGYEGITAAAHAFTT